MKKLLLAPVTFAFGFTPGEYFLVHNLDVSAIEHWSLNPRIDRSNKGKDDDIGVPKLARTHQELCSRRSPDG